MKFLLLATMFISGIALGEIPPFYESPLQSILEAESDDGMVYLPPDTSTIMSFIEAMLTQRESNFQILNKIDPRQRVIVDGEQDNQWHP